MPGKAGCKNVIELHGNVYDNFCPHCGRKYPMEYIRDAKKIPLCEKCQIPVRPKVMLFGEQVDNQLMTHAVNEISKADVLLLLGTTFSSGLCDQYVKYFEGSSLILINGQEHFMDEKADVILHEEVKTALPKIVWPEGKKA